MAPPRRPRVGMHKVLKTPELLEHIFDFWDEKKTLSILAQCCKTFRDVALDILWSDMESPFPLLILLGNMAPKNMGNHHAWDYVNPRVSWRDWERYELYSVRVKRITFSGGGAAVNAKHTHYPISPAAFSAVALTQPRDISLLPNLRTFTISPTSESIIQWFPFFDQCQNKTEATIKITNGDRGLLAYVLEELNRRVDKLSIIHIESNVAIGNLQANTLALLSAMSCLRQVTLPPYYVNSDTLGSLDELEHLQKISINFQHAQMPVPNDQILRNPSGCSLQNLTKLAVASTLEPLFPLLADRSWVPQLTEVDVLSSESNPKSLHDFSVIIAQHRSQITSLRLDLFGLRDVTEAIGFQHISPLLGCLSMSVFVLHHRLPCRFETEHLEQVLRQWPSLTEISICINPISLPANNNSSFSIDILNTFAWLCPNVKKVGLLFDGSGSLQWSHRLRLPKLQEIYVGWTTPKDPHEVALYLASICDGGVEFLACKNGFGTYSADQVKESAWQEVAKLFKLFTRNRERTVAETRERERAASPGWRLAPKEKRPILAGPKFNDTKVDRD